MTDHIKPPNIIYNQDNDNAPAGQSAGQSSSGSKDHVHHESSTSTTMDDTEAFDRIANKLLRSGMLLTALELHAELIERGKECSRLREFFDNPHNFEKHFDNHNLNSTSSNILNPKAPISLTHHQPLPSTSGMNNPTMANNPDIQIGPSTSHQGNLSMERTCPSEKNSFDSFDFTHYSDDDDDLMERSHHGDQRIAVLEFELRKAQQTIKSLRASLTMSTVQNNNVDDSMDNHHLSEHLTMTDIDADINMDDRPTNHFNMDKNPSQAQSSLSNHNNLINSSECHFLSSRTDFFGRGSADGDSCPGEDDPAMMSSTKLNTTNRLASSFGTNSDFDLQPSGSELHKYSLGTSIKPHERRALNYLINEYLMANNYKISAITFCDENTEQDFDSWDDVGLNVQRPPDLLRLFRMFWKHRTSAGSTTNPATTTSQPSNQTGAILIRTNSNITNRTITGTGTPNMD